MTEQALRCACGKLRGRHLDASPKTTHRLVCYCDDCRAFVRFLDRREILDGHGGSAIVLTAPADVTFSQGQEWIRCLRLSPKGLHRWYADCCKTPLANTVGPAWPFVSLNGAVVEGAAEAMDRAFGPPRSGVHGASALGGTPEGASRSVPPALVARAARLALSWKLSGKGSPSPFYDARTKAPVSAAKVLTREERDALRDGAA